MEPVQAPRGGPSCPSLDDAGPNRVPNGLPSGVARPDASRESIRAALDKTKELPGINGPITYTPDNHIGQDTRGLAMLKLQGGKFVPVA